MENQNQPSSSNEIDLGQLFELIGKGVKKLFDFINSVLRGIFDLFIQFLLFIQKHFIKFTIAGAIGIIVGWIFDVNKEPVYRSSMVVEPNFNSVQQLYNNVEFYNELAKEKENEVLADVFNITPELAATIKKVKIESFSDQTQKLKQFSEFIQGLDSITRKLITYEDYLRGFNDMSARIHKIQIETTNPLVAKKCQNAIVRSIENNNYFKLQKQVNDQNLEIQDLIIEKQLIEIDSLQIFYKKLKVIEASKANGATSINLAEKEGESYSEIELLRQVRLLKESKIALNTRKANTENTINVISDFPRKGALINDFFSKMKFLLPILFLFFTVLFISLISLNRFLKNYREK